MEISDLLSVGGLAIVVSVIVEVVKRAWKPSDEQMSRFGPLLALGTALLIGIPAAWYQGADLAQSILTGVLAGASASGLYDLVSSQAPRKTT